MSADFTKKSNYSEDTSFNEVVFGAYAPVLEVELNEAQEIADTKFKRLAQMMGACVHPTTGGSVSFKGTTLTLTNCVVVTDSFSAFIPKASVSVSGTNKYAFVKLEKATVTGNSTLKKYGLTDGSTISNPITDSRVNAETTRRTVIRVTLMSGSSVPSNSANICYAPVGRYDGSEFIPEYVAPSLTDLGFTVNESGELCIMYED